MNVFLMILLKQFEQYINPLDPIHFFKKHIGNFKKVWVSLVTNKKKKLKVENYWIFLDFYLLLSVCEFL